MNERKTSMKRSEPDSRSDTLLSCKTVLSPDGNLSTLTSGMDSARPFQQKVLSHMFSLQTTIFSRTKILTISK